MTEPVITMTPLTYWTRWTVVGLVALALARWILVQPIVDACGGR